MDRHPEAMTIAYRRAVGKTTRINTLGISSNMTEDETNNMIKQLAMAKADRENAHDWKQFVKGQRYYVESLQKFSGLNAHERLEYEYSQAFPEVADECQMLNSLEALI